MKKIFILLCFAVFGLGAVHYENQFENSQIRIVKAKLLPQEEVPPHRYAYPHVVIALQGGTVTRLEADGRMTEVEFPTGVSVFRPADPENELHRTVNNSSEPIEIIIVQLMDSPSFPEKIEGAHEISMNIKIQCPMSPELKSFVRSLPEWGEKTVSFEDWKCSFVSSMTRLIELVESEKVHSSLWTVECDVSRSEASEAEER